MAPSPIVSDTLSEDVIIASNNAYVYSQSIVPARQARIIDSVAKKLGEEKRRGVEALLSSLEAQRVDLIKQLQLTSASTIEDLPNEALEKLATYELEYHVNLGKITASKPLVLASQTLTNDSIIEQEMAYVLDQTETHTSTFEFTSGYTVGASVTVKGKPNPWALQSVATADATSPLAGIPLVSEGEFTVSTEFSQSFAIGTETSSSKSYTASFPLKAPPHTTAHAVSTVTRGTLEVPYTLHIRFQFPPRWPTIDRKYTSHGFWRGVSTWDLRHKITTTAS